MNSRATGADATLYDGPPGPMSQNLVGSLFRPMPPSSPGTHSAATQGRPAGSVAAPEAVPAAEVNDLLPSNIDRPTTQNHPRILPDHLLPPDLDTLDLQAMRAIQHETKHFVAMDDDLRCQAEHLEEKFLEDVFRLAIRRQVLADLLLNHLARRRSMRGPSSYNNFYQNSREARAIHASGMPWSMRSTLIAEEWHNLDEDTRALWDDDEYVQSMMEETAREKSAAQDAQQAGGQGNRSSTSGTAKPPGKATRSAPKYDYYRWASEVKHKMNALRQTDQIEAILIVTPWDPERKPLVVATPTGTAYVNALRNMPAQAGASSTRARPCVLDEFAHFVTGKAIEAKLQGVCIEDVVRPTVPQKRGRGQVAPEFEHLGGYTLKQLKTQVTDGLKKLLSDTCRDMYVHGWPGKKTAQVLQERYLVKIQIDEQSNGFDGSLLLMPGRDWTKQVTLQIKNALDKGWIRLKKLKGKAKARVQEPEEEGDDDDSIEDE